jgi:3-dehydroquinate synthase
LLPLSGAYFAPVDTYLDFSFLKTLPEGQVRNGTAELIKICTVSEKRIWDLLVKHGKQLVETGYGFKNDKELKAIGDDICKSGIEEMLRVSSCMSFHQSRSTADSPSPFISQLESGNLHELMLDRVIAFGHSWSPTCELGTSPLPLSKCPM